MNKTTGTIITAVMMLPVLGGCIIYHDRPPDRPAEMTILEIQAVCRLPDRQARRDLLVQIASKPSLDQEAQVYLARQTVTCLLDFGDKRDVLVSLAENPVLGTEGLRAVLDALNGLPDMSDRRAVLEAVGRGRRNTPAHHPRAPPHHGPAVGSGSQGLACNLDHNLLQWRLHAESPRPSDPGNTDSSIGRPDAGRWLHDHQYLRFDRRFRGTFRLTRRRCAYILVTRKWRRSSAG